MADGTIITADSVELTITGTSGTVTMDASGEVGSVYLPMGSHSTNKWTSQEVKTQTMTKDGTWEAISIPCTFSSTDYGVIKNMWRKAEKVTYSVSGGGLATKSWTDCLVRVTEGPNLIPGYDGLQSCTIEISCVASITGTGT